MKLYSGSSPYISIDQTTVGYNQDGIFLGIDSSKPKFSLVGSDSAMIFDGDSLAITGGSLTVGLNQSGSGSIEIDEDGIRGFYDGVVDDEGDPIPKFKLSNSTGLLEAVNIFLQSGNKTAEIGNLSNSIAGNFGFEITNNGGFYLDKTDISFTAVTKTISSTITDLSVYKKGNKIVVAGSVSNDTEEEEAYTVAADGIAIMSGGSIVGYSLQVVENLVDEAAGAELTISRAQPFKVSVTDDGFFITTVQATSAADKAMSVEYDSNRIFAKRLLIADVEDEETAAVVIGSIAASSNFNNGETYGVIVSSGGNKVYMTGEGFKIVQGVNETFKVNEDGTITARRLAIRNDSRLGGWFVGETSFASTNYATYVGTDNPISPTEGQTWFNGIDYKTFTSGVWVITAEGVFSTSGIRFNNNGTIIGKQFAINSSGDASFRGDLTAATGTFGATNAGHIILGNSSNPLQVKSDTTSILNLTSAGVLTFAGFTATNSRLTAGTTGEAIGVGPSMGNNVSFYAGAAVTSPALLPTAEQIDNAPFKVTKAGALTATSGKIANWTLGNTSLTAGTDGTSVGVTTDAVAFYAGNATPGSAPFRVTREGVLNATGATISGAITATSGTFTGTVNANAGNFTSTVTVGSGATSGTINVGTDANTNKIVIVGTNDDDTTRIYSGVGTYNNANTPFYFDATGKFSLKDKLVWDGTNLNINGGGTFSGALSAATGTFSGALSAATGTFAGELSAATGSFSGSLSAATGSFSGSLSAATGTFGAVSIASGGSLTVGTNITINNTDGIKGTNGTTTAFQLNPNGTGSIGGFNYGLSSITSTNLTLSSGTSPYLYFGADATPAYGDVGAFLGIVSSTPKFSLVSGTGGTDGFLKYDPSATYDLEIGGNAKVGPLLVNNISSSTATVLSGEFSASGDDLNSNISSSFSETRTFNFSPSLNIRSISFNYNNGYPSLTVTITYRLYFKSQLKKQYSTSASTGSNSYSVGSIDIQVDQIQIQVFYVGGSLGSFTNNGITFTKNVESLSIDNFRVYTSGNVYSTAFENDRIVIKDNIITVSSASGDADLTLPFFRGNILVARSLGSTSISHSGAGDSAANFTVSSHTINVRNVYRVTWSIGSEVNYIISYVSIDGSSTVSVPFSVQRSSGTGANAWFEYVGKVRRTSATTWKLVDCFSHFYDASYENDDDIAAVTIHLREIELISE
jgi:hypothetical protein